MLRAFTVILVAYLEFGFCGRLAGSRHNLAVMMMGCNSAMGAFPLHILLRWLVVRCRVVCTSERDHVASQRRSLESR